MLHMAAEHTVLIISYSIKPRKQPKIILAVATTHPLQLTNLQRSLKRSYHPAEWTSGGRSWKVETIDEIAGDDLRKWGCARRRET